MNSPCMYCEPPNRKLRCHSTCKEFQEYRKELDRRNQLRKDYYKSEIYEYRREFFRRIK